MDDIYDVVVSDVGISNHYLVKCKVAATISCQPTIRAIFRNWKKLDLGIFRQRLIESSAYLLPAETVDNYTAQLEADITGILDQLIPICTSTKRRSKPVSHWLSTEAVKAKPARRRLERK